MPKKKGEQLELIDVTPKNAKKIVECARRYKAVQAERLEALEREKKEKQALLDLIEKEDLQRLENGVIRFQVDGMIITVKPRDELIQVKEKTEEE